MKLTTTLPYRNHLGKLFLTLALVVFGSGHVWGDGTLTAFNDATSTTNNFPISGGYVNTAGIRSEFIIPRTEISSLAGKIITALTFFHRDGKNWGSAQFKIYLKEVNQTTFSSKEFLGSYDSPAYDGTLSFSSTPNESGQYELNISLNKSFPYSGTKDLLIGFYCSIAGSTGYPYFYADYKSSTNYGLYTTYYNGNFSYSYGYYRLKTKFAYQDPTTPVLNITHPISGDGFGYVTTNTTKTYTVKNIGVGSMDVNIASSDNKYFTVSTSSLTGITNDGVGKTFDVTFNYDALHPEPHYANITITPTFDGAIADVISVSAGPEVELNEDKATTWTTGSGKNVYLKYTAKNGWNTICFPVSVNSYKTQLFGSDATVKAYAFNNYDSSTGTLSFEKASYLSAGTPYLVYVENAASAPFVINDINVGYGPAAAGSTLWNSVYFKGSFMPMAAGSMTGFYGVTSDGKLRKAGSEAYMKGYRAYFIGSFSSARIITIDEDGETTDLGFVKMVDPEAKKVFNLQGQRVEKGRKGIYIVNGKKVVIK